MADIESCCFCDRYFPNRRLLMKHIRVSHESDPLFVINCSICGKSYKKWCSLKKHLQRSHKGMCRLIGMCKKGELKLQGLH